MALNTLPFLPFLSSLATSVADILLGASTRSRQLRRSASEADTEHQRACHLGESTTDRVETVGLPTDCEHKTLLFTLSHGVGPR